MKHTKMRYCKFSGSIQKLKYIPHQYMTVSWKITATFPAVNGH